MKYLTIIFLAGLSISCENNKSLSENDYIQAARDYGVWEFIEIDANGPNFEEISMEDWIEFLEHAAKAKKLEKHYQKKLELEEKILAEFNQELDEALTQEERDLIWQKYASKHDWIVLAKDEQSHN